MIFLIQTLSPDPKTYLLTQGSSVERSGAAQGLAEVLAVVGDQYFDLHYLNPKP